MRYYSLLLCFGILTGCASASPTYAPDGRQAYSLNCSGAARNWGMCYQKAGEICQGSGYDVLHQNGEQGVMVQGKSNAHLSGGSHSIFGNSSSNLLATTTNRRTMTVACKG